MKTSCVVYFVIDFGWRTHSLSLLSLGCLGRKLAPLIITWTHTHKQESWYKPDIYTLPHTHNSTCYIICVTALRSTYIYIYIKNATNRAACKDRNALRVARAPWLHPTSVKSRLACGAATGALVMADVRVCVYGLGLERTSAPPVRNTYILWTPLGQLGYNSYVHINTFHTHTHVTTNFPYSCYICIYCRTCAWAPRNDIMTKENMKHIYIIKW